MDTLDVWPALPLIISDSHCPSNGSDNIVAFFEHSDRVCQINYVTPWRSSSSLKNVLEAVQKPFPELTDLVLLSYHGTTLVAPDSFLGGSTPRLRNLCISFPGLPKLLFSAPHLVGLFLYGIPPSGYILPEEMLAVLSTLTSLELFHLHFQSPVYRPNRPCRHPPHSTRTVLPVLTGLLFKGVSEYLDDLVACIDAPQVSKLELAFFNQIVFDTPHLARFISCTPRLKVFKNVHVVFDNRADRIKLSSQNFGHRELIVDILYGGSDGRLSSLKQVCRLLPPVSTSEDLYIYEKRRSPLDWQDNLEIVAWLELLHAFTAVKNVYLSERLAPNIAPALQEPVSGRMTEVLPALQNIFLEGLEEPSGPVQEGIEKFVAARQVTGHSIAVASWERHEK